MAQENHTSTQIYGISTIKLSPALAEPGAFSNLADRDMICSQDPPHSCAELGVFGASDQFNVLLEQFNVLHLINLMYSARVAELKNQNNWNAVGGLLAPEDAPLFVRASPREVNHTKFIVSRARTGGVALSTLQQPIPTLAEWIGLGPPMAQESH